MDTVTDTQAGPRGPITRRQLIVGAAAAAAAAAAAGVAVTRHPTGSLLSDNRSARSGDASKRILVLVTLYGGNDGLNTVIPYEDGAYLSGRGALALQANEVLPLGERLGLHPSLKGFKGLWDRHQLAIVRGVGYPNPNRSHFRSMDIWQSGVPESSVASGWLGRWLDATGTDPMRAIALGSSVPRALAGDTTAAAAIPVGPLRLGGGAALASAFAEMTSAGASGPRLAALVDRSGSDLLRVRGELARVLDTSTTAPPSASGGGTNLEGSAVATPPAGKAPKGGLAAQLDVVARAINGGLPTKVYAVSLGGFDNHAAERATHARVLGDLDQAVDQFFQSLATGKRSTDVVMAIHSEFGRRVDVNGSGGTDHGTAAPVFVVGAAVRGGFHGEEPSLTNLDDGDLRFTTDFRTVYASLLGGVIGVDPKVSLGRSFTPVALFS